MKLSQREINAMEVLINAIPEECPTTGCSACRWGATIMNGLSPCLPVLARSVLIDYEKDHE